MRDVERTLLSCSVSVASVFRGSSLSLSLFRVIGDGVSHSLSCWPLAYYYSSVSSARSGYVIADRDEFDVKSQRKVSVWES